MDANAFSYTPLAIDATRQITSDVGVTRTSQGHAVTAGTVTRSLASWQAAIGLAHLWQAAIAADGLGAFSAEMNAAPVTLIRTHLRSRVVRPAGMAAGDAKPSGPMYYRTTDEILSGRPGRVLTF